MGVVVTGMGVISTAGYQLDTFWSTLVAGKKTYGEIEEFKNNSNFRVKIGAKIVDELWFNGKDSIKKRYGRASNYAVAASLAAISHSGLTSGDLPRGRTGICMGTTMGEIQVEEELTEIRCKHGLNEVPMELAVKYNTNNITNAVKEVCKIEGPVYMLPTACAAGNYAIALGKRLIEWKQADIVLAGGVDVFSRVAFSGFQRLLSLAAESCKPFDKTRTGLVVGEGCGVLVLENSEFAKARGAKIYGEIKGCGLTSDRYHMTAPHPDGDGATRAIQLSLNEAKLDSNEIDYVSAHGTGTPINDKVESKVLIDIFGENHVPPTSSIKSMLGHSMGAASALELIASLQMLEKGILLPTINFETPDPDCPIDCIPNRAREANVDYILSNSFAFGGQVSSIIIGRG